MKGAKTRKGGQEGAKNQKGGHILKILYWMFAATRVPNVKWGGGTTGPPLATALTITNEKSWT